MYEFTSRDGTLREMKFPGHMDEFEFSQKCGGNVKPGSIKQIWEAMRCKGKMIEYIKCDRTTLGAKPVTVGVVR